MSIMRSSCIFYVRVKNRLCWVFNRNSTRNREKKWEMSLNDEEQAGFKDIMKLGVPSEMDRKRRNRMETIKTHKFSISLCFLLALPAEVYETQQILRSNFPKGSILWVFNTQKKEGVKIAFAWSHFPDQ